MTTTTTQHQLSLTSSYSLKAGTVHIATCTCGWASDLAPFVRDAQLAHQAHVKSI